MVVAPVNVKANFLSCCGIVALVNNDSEMRKKETLMKFIKVLASAVTAVTLLVSSASPQVLAYMNRDAGTIVVDGKTFSSAKNCKGENWKYDAKSRTLSLDGYDGMYIDLGHQEEETVIELSGTNKVISNVEAPAIQVEGDLTIRGEGSLDLQVTSCHSAVYAKNGDLTVDHCKLDAGGHGDVADSAYLLMADGDVTISGANISIQDEINGTGGAVGSLKGNILINDGTAMSIFSRSKALTSFAGAVRIEGSSTSAELFATESAIYAKTEITVTGAKSVRAESNKTDSTAVYCPEGTITISETPVDIASSGAAIAGKNIEIRGGYISDPFDAEMKEVSGMISVVLGTDVVKEAHIQTGVKPTATPTPSPTPTPVPTATPTPEPSENTGFQITPRMMIGGGMVVIALVVIAVLIIGKMRSR